MKIKTFFSRILLLFVFFLTSCTFSQKKIWIHFETNGGSLLQDILLEKNEDYNLPIPNKENYYFINWFEDEQFSKVYIKTNLKQSITLYAKFERCDSFLEIFTCEDFLNAGNSSQNMYFMNDLDFNYQKINPFGNEYQPYSGYILGNSYKVSNVWVLTPDNNVVGIFAYFTGYIDSLNFQQIFYEYHESSVGADIHLTMGGIIGFSKGNTHILNCTIDSSADFWITTHYTKVFLNIGGIIGFNDSFHTILSNNTVLFKMSGETQSSYQDPDIFLGKAIGQSPEIILKNHLYDLNISLTCLVSSKEFLIDFNKSIGKVTF